MQKKSRVRLVDVAAAAQVSKQTVSRVVNGSRDVSQETREHVLEVIARMGYRPSVSARTLCRGRSNTLAVVASDTGFLATELYQGAAQQAQALGYTLLLRTLNTPAAASVEQLLLSLTDMEVDGVLWAIPDADGRGDWIDAALLRRIGVPVVFLSTAPRTGISTVSFDNFAGARLATRALVDAGRLRIGHVSGPRGWWVARERIRGWRTELAASGREAPEDWIEAGDWSPASGERAVARLLERVPDLDAIFVANDRMALGGLLAAHRRGLQIPARLAIMGFDNVPESACFYPPLSTVSQDKHHHGEHAVAVLVGHVAAGFGEAPPAMRLPELGHTLMLRETTPPR
ncbi:MAG: LacI family DNA-binding transcriptional regulator [Candidatus Dactylopiibacterium sp.]|nr:LacI family DNA-binding transcriptional regulator [Candidatus Dactylopiibacterium sp.]